MSEHDNETAASNDSEKKIFPDWKVSGDNQNIIIGLSVLLLALGGLGLRGCDGDDAVDVPAVVSSNDDGGNASGPLVLGSASTSPATTPATTAPAPTTTAPTATTAAATTVPAPTTTAAPANLSPDVAAAVAAYTGVTGSADGTTAILTGFVDSDAQSAEAEAAAAAVPGIEAVDNQLVGVDKGALAALTEQGVTNPVVTVSGLVATVGGALGSEADRQPTLDAVAAVPGVESVVDQLVAGPSVTDALNELVELTPIEFATSSAELLPTSNATLDAAAKILTDAPDSAVIEVQGYTDIRGDANANLALSDERAAAVVAALVERGVAAERLTSKGYGGTTQFGEGNTAEAYAANRRVVFAVVK